MKKTYKNYAIESRPDSNYVNVLKNSKIIATAVDEYAARQIIYSKIGDGKILDDSDFRVTTNKERINNE